MRKAVVGRLDPSTLYKAIVRFTETEAEANCPRVKSTKLTDPVPAIEKTIPTLLLPVPIATLAAFDGRVARLAVLSKTAAALEQVRSVVAVWDTDEY